MSHCWAAAGSELIYAARTEIISLVEAEKSTKSGGGNNEWERF
jgi:hypothetical protein